MKFNSKWFCKLTILLQYNSHQIYYQLKLLLYPSIVLSVHHFNGDFEFHYLKSHNILQLTCICSSYAHYQAVLQIYDGLNPASVDNIESQRARCLQTLVFPVMNESFSHHITVFVESVDYGVLGAHVFFTGQIPQISSSAQLHKTFLLHYRLLITSMVSFKKQIFQFLLYNCNILVVNLRMILVALSTV